MNMQFKKVLVGIGAVCLMMGVSLSASAQVLDPCPFGKIEGEQIDGDLVLNGRSCFVKDTFVDGDVRVTNSGNFTMIDSEVRGDVRVTGGEFTLLLGNTVRRGNLVANNNARAEVLLNIVSRIIRVNRNGKADVKRNASLVIVCNDNIRLDSFENEAERNRCRIR